MELLIKNIQGHNSEIGAILTAVIGGPVNSNEKEIIEAALRDYADKKMYPNEGLNFYSEINADTPSIVVIRGINSLPYQTIQFT